MQASALSLNKKQSSTYNKYACGCFLYAPSICSTYFQKANGMAIAKNQHPDAVDGNIANS